MLTVIDSFTRYIKIIPLEGKSSREVANALFTHVFCVFGPPEAILSDNGGEFTSSLMDDITSLLEIQHKLTFSKVATGNASNERSHLRIIHSLRAVAEKRKDNWAKYISAFEFAYNTSPLPNSHNSPYELVYARTPREMNFTMTHIPHHKPGRDLRPTDEEIIDLKEVAKEMRDEFRTMQRLQRLENTQPFYGPQYKPGDKVLIKYENTRDDKLDSPGDGPYEVLAQKGVRCHLRHCITGNELPKVDVQVCYPWKSKTMNEPAKELQDNTGQTSQGGAPSTDAEGLSLQGGTTPTQTKPDKKRRQRQQPAQITIPTDWPAQEARINDFAIFVDDNNHSIRVGKITDITNETIHINLYANPRLDHSTDTTSQQQQIPLRSRTWKPRKLNTITNKIDATHEIHRRYTQQTATTTKGKQSQSLTYQHTNT
jgi:hypothetical protein